MDDNIETTLVDSMFQTCKDTTMHYRNKQPYCAEVTPKGDLTTCDSETKVAKKKT